MPKRNYNGTMPELAIRMVPPDELTNTEYIFLNKPKRNKTFDIYIKKRTMESNTLSKTRKSILC